MSPGWWSHFRSFDEKGILIDRVDGELAFTKKGYVFDRRIFKVFLILVFGGLVYYLSSSTVGLHEFYIYCPGVTPCDNHFYHACDRVECSSIVNLETLPAGFELGKKPSVEFSRTIKSYVLFIIGGLFVSFVVNHLRHNRGRKLDTILALEVEEK